MFLLTPALNNYDKVDFIQFESFLVAKGVNSDFTWAGPADTFQMSLVIPHRVCIAYSPVIHGKAGPLAVTYFYMNGKQVQISSRLSAALKLLAFMFDSPTNLQTLSNLDPELPASEAVNALDVRYANFLTPKVGQYLPGEHLAKAGSVWRYYLVEDYGEVVPLADCELAAPLVARAWVDQEAERTDLASRLAKFIPPDSADIIAGRKP